MTYLKILLYEKTKLNKKINLSEFNTTLATINEIICWITLIDENLFINSRSTFLDYNNVEMWKNFKNYILNSNIFEENIYDGDKKGINILTNLLEIIISGSYKKKKKGKELSPDSLKYLRICTAIKILQGNDQGLNIRRNISFDHGGGSYFTNTKTRLLEAINDDISFIAKTNQKKKAKLIYNYLYDPNQIAHPADVLFTNVNQTDESKILGISLKASFKDSSIITLANLGENDYYFKIPKGPILDSVKKMIKPSKERKELFKLLQNRIATNLISQLTTYHKIELFFRNLLHIQSNNLPYIIIASQNIDTWGINMFNFREDIIKSSEKSCFWNIKILPISNKSYTHIISIDCKTNKIGKCTILFKFRIKYKGKINNAQKINLGINITLHNKSKNLLKNEYPFGIKK